MAEVLDAMTVKMLFILFYRASFPSPLFFLLRHPSTALSKSTLAFVFAPFSSKKAPPPTTPTFL